MIFKASADQAVELVKILRIYEKATGQQVNVEKSAITFGAKVEESTKILIKDITGISKEGGSGSYLGLPECFSGSKTEMLAYIYDSLKNRLSGWFAKLLSMGGEKGGLVRGGSYDNAGLRNVMLQIYQEILLKPYQSHC